MPRALAVRPAPLAVFLALSALQLIACGPSPAMDAPPPPPSASPPPATLPATPTATRETPPPAAASTVSPAASTAPAASSAAPSAAPAGPAVVLKLSQGQLPDADKDLAAADAKVRECLGKAKTQPKKGELGVKITVSTSGFALNVATTASGDVGKDVATCAKAALRDQSFGKPVGGGVAAVSGTYSFP